MKIFKGLAVVVAASCFSIAATAADFDGSETLMCSLAVVQECDAGSECHSVTNLNVDAPDFMKFDVKKKKSTAITAGVESSSGDIDNVVNLSRYLVLQGVQGGAEGAADSLAWSVTINHETGLMVISASGEDAAFVIYGKCTPL